MSGYEPGELVESPGYHIRAIAKGELGEASKILEEAFELADAAEQGVAVMELVELSDLVGAVRAYLSKHHPSITLEDLVKMADVTERAFKSGRRS